MQTDGLLVMAKRIAGSEMFGERLRALREARGLTQEELGRMVGLSQRMVWHYETYGDLPLAKLLPALAKALKASTDELVGVKPLKDEFLSRNKKLMRRFKLVENLPLRDQRMVFSLINALVAKQESRKGDGRGSGS